MIHLVIKNVKKQLEPKKIGFQNADADSNDINHKDYWKRYETWNCWQNCAMGKVAEEKKQRTDELMVQAMIQKSQQKAPKSEEVDMKQIGMLLGVSMLGLGFLVYMVKR